MKRFLIGLFLAFPVLAMAQANFQKGYVVTSSKDTVRGFIDYRERHSHPESIRFRQNDNAAVQTYTVTNCVAFGLDGLESYRRHEVKMSMYEEAVSKLTSIADSVLVRDTVFLRILQAGEKVTLYDYIDDIKKRFFIAELNGVPYELIRRFYLDEESRNMAVANSYVTQLSQIAYRLGFEAQFDRRRLNAVKYRTDDLLKVTSVLNNMQEVKVKGSKIRFLAGSGISSSKAAYIGDHLLAGPDAKSRVTYSPFLNVGIDVFSNPAIGKLIGRAELSVFRSKNEITSPQRFHSFDLITISATPQIIHNIYNKRDLKFFAGVGMVVNYSIVNNDVQKRYNIFREELVPMEEPIVFEKISISFTAKLGVVLHRKIEVYGGYFSPNAASHYQKFNVVNKRITAGINYLFGK